MMPTLEELAAHYSEDYSDQDAQDFAFLVFKPYGAPAQIEAVGDNLTRQAHEIYKKYGRTTPISVYK